MESIDGHVKQIIKAQADNKLAIFVGAGVSLSSNIPPIKLPSWADLIGELQQELNLNGEETDNLKVAQLYYLEFGEVTYYNKIKEFFPENVNPSDIHKLILDIGPKYIITTNWDCIFEKAIQVYAPEYDVICSDKDLVKSRSSKCLVKMHGDFKNHNIVFKEDDYLSYNHNFPLISNFVRSILSTHTVMFLGYSYNDINLKHIMKWIQNHSAYTPPMYLVEFKKKDTQIKYLENHGIMSLILNKGYYPEYQEEPAQNDWRSQLLASFLDNIRSENASREKIISKKNLAHYIYERLKHLESLDYVSLEQIQSALSNCGYKYDDNSLPILEFYAVKGVATTDYNEKVRELYQGFTTELSNVTDESKLDPNDKILDKIFYILAKANIAGVFTSTDESGRKTYATNEQLPEFNTRLITHRKILQASNSITFNENKFKNISYLAAKAYELYQAKNYEAAFNVTLELLSECKQQKNYSQLLIAIFNRNVLIWYLKYSRASDNSAEYQHLKELDLHEQFTFFPKDQQKKLQALFQLVSLNRIYEIAYNTAATLNKVNEAANTIKNGGMCFNNYANKPSAEHVDLLLFTAINRIMIDRYDEYKSCIKNFVEIAVVRQSVQQNIKFNTYELFSAINYFSNAELKTLLQRLLIKNETHEKLLLDAVDFEWLLNDMFNGCIDNFISEPSMFNKPENELQNMMTLLSVIELNADNTSHIMEQFEKLTVSSQISLDMYRSINEFLANQHSIFNNNFENEILIRMIDILIDKVVYRKASGWDYLAITNNAIDNLYGLIDANKGIYTNSKLIRKLITRLRELDIDNKIRYSKSLLLSIFEIGNAGIQKMIKSFIVKILKDLNFTDDELNPRHSDKFYFSFLCLATGLVDKLEDNTIVQFKIYLETAINDKAFSSSFYALKRVLDHLVNEKDTKSLIEVQSMLNNIFALYADRPKPSAI